MAEQAEEVSDAGEIDAPEVEQELEAESSQDDAPEAAEQGDEQEAEAEPEKAPEREEPDPQAIIREAAFKEREAKRMMAEATRIKEETEARERERAAPVRPDVPALPDRLDYSSDQEYLDAVAKRDAAIQQAAQYDSYVKFQQQQEEAKKAQAQQQAQQELQERVTAYSQKAEKLGVSAAELQRAGAAIAPHVQDRIAERILRDDVGPEITIYLANNMQEVDKMEGMDVVDAAVYLETVIKPSARRPPPKLAPEPTESPSGAGMPEGKSGPEGATYE